MRKLLYVPIIHGEQDLGSAASALDRQAAALCGEERWAQHKERVARFWDNLARYLSGVDALCLKIYQDGLPVGGTLGRRIVEEAARRGSRNHQVILDLLERGAEIRKTEDPALLQEEYGLIARLAQPAPPAQASLAYNAYMHRRDQLTAERDRFVASAIGQTLREGEVGVLFMGSYHDVLSHLPKDIQVEQLKEREKVNLYFRQLASGVGDQGFEELAEYVVSPSTR